MADKLDILTNEIEQGFSQRGGWKACRYLLGELAKDHTAKVGQVVEDANNLADQLREVEEYVMELEKRIACSDGSRF